MTCGENISCGCDTALNVLVQLIIDDGVPSRGHRSNIFGPNWTEHGCFTGEHTVYTTMTCQNFAGGSYAKGSANPLETLINEFMAEKSDFTGMEGMPPAEMITGTKTSVQCQYAGKTCTKTTTKTFGLSNGKQVTLTKVETRTFS